MPLIDALFSDVLKGKGVKLPQKIHFSFVFVRAVTWPDNLQPRYTAENV
jgi:hypothetical protein